MKGPRIRIQAAALTFILLPAAAGVVAVHASATCERFVRTYVTKPVRNKVSQATADAWAKWRIAHPNWKPNPDVHRPKYVMTHEESVQKVNFACTIPVIPSDTNQFFMQADFEPPPIILNFPPMKATQIEIPNEVPPEVAEITPDNSWPPLGPFVPPVLGGPPTTTSGTPGVPVVPPEPPPITGEVPEPVSLMLVGTGLGVLALMLAKFRTTKEENPA